MRFESKEQLAAHFWDDPELSILVLSTCPGLTSLPALPETLNTLIAVNCPDLTTTCPASKFDHSVDGKLPRS